MIKFFKSVFNIREEKKLLLFLILLSFLIAFALARAYSLFIVKSIFYIRGYHIHHFYFGTLSLVVGGLIGILNKGKKQLRYASVLMGVGMGLFADELGLLLNCTSNNRQCSYAFPDSFDIFTTIAFIIILLMVLIDFIERFRSTKKFVPDSEQENILK